jgi:hypothetical protein
MVVIFPGGIGPRELALIAALAPAAPRGPALVVAIVSRLLMTGSDLAWAGAGLIIGRLLARSLERTRAVGPPAAAGQPASGPLASPQVSARPARASPAGIG